MKNLTFVIGLILLMLNLLCWLLLSCYNTFNAIASSVIIIVNVVLLWFVDGVHLKDGYRVSLNCLFSFFAFIEFLCMVFCRPYLEDNIVIVIVLLAIVLQIILLVGANYMSKTIK